MAKHGKKYLEAEKLVEPGKLYQPQEAISLLKKMNYVKFDPTVEVHMKLGVDPRHADQMVRGVTMLPAGTGKDVKVLVFAQGEKANEAEAAGAFDVAKTIREAKEGRIEFKVDKTALLHIPAGKLSFSEEALMANITAVIDSVVRAKPSGSKGAYVKSVVLSSTMSPSVRLDVPTAIALKPV